jgi:hypothetical protein
MKTSTLWIIRVALTVQFLGVLSVPALLASTDAPRAIWLAEWLNAGAASSTGEPSGRTIGVLRLRDGQLVFSEQVGQVEWTVDLSAVKRVSSVSGRALSIETMGGETYLLAVLESNLMTASPRRAVSLLERAVQMQAATASR